ncbi:MAG: CDC48 family AAA ATPase [Methanotrichaceae archaeon]
MIESITLKVVEAHHRDAGRSIARMDQNMMRELGLDDGDVVEIRGNKTACAVAWPGYRNSSSSSPSSSSSSTTSYRAVRIDGELRSNLGVGIDDRVVVRKTAVRPADRIVFAPTEQIRLIGGPQYLLRTLTGRPVVKGERLRVKMISGSLGFVVINTTPKGPVLVTPDTNIKILKEPLHELSVREISYEDIGGLAREIRMIREMIELPLRYPQVFNRLGITPPRGLLLHGPPGTGKTLIARAVAGETDTRFMSISGPEIISKFYGDSEKRLREIFDEAERNAPSIVFIDEVDAIAPKREEVSGDLELRVVAQLLALMDGLSSRGEVIVIAATNRPNALDPALRRGGRFDREIEIGIPDKIGRLEILYVHTRGMPFDESLNLEEIAEVTHGFVGADLASLCKEAAMHTLSRLIPDLDDEKDIPPEVLEELRVGRRDFQEALKKIEPSAMREVFVEVAEVHWDDVGGLEEAKQELIEAVEWPLKYPEVFSSVGIRPPRGVLLYGPSGTGKTLLAKAVATESQINFISVKGPELLSKWVGESERAVREVFRKAKLASPALIFFDEIDSIVPARGCGLESQVTERVVSQFLIEMDGLEELRDVVVLAASNRPDLIDPSLLRPGRFDRMINIPLPDKKARERILAIHLREMPLAGDVSIPELAELTENLSGAEIETLCREAGMAALREQIRPGMDGGPPVLDRVQVEMRHFDHARRRVEDLLTPGLVEEYQDMIEDFEV